MERICLDFDFLIRFLKGDEKAKGKIVNYVDEEIGISSWTAFEIMHAVKDPLVSREVLRTLSVYSFDLHSAIVCNKIVGKFREKRSLLPTFRTLITASCCIRYDAYLVTFNRREYENIPHLQFV